MYSFDGRFLAGQKPYATWCVNFNITSHRPPAPLILAKINCAAATGDRTNCLRIKPSKDNGRGPPMYHWPKNRLFNVCFFEIKIAWVMQTILPFGSIWAHRHKVSQGNIATRDVLGSAKSTSLSKVGLLLFCRNYLAGLICNSYPDYHPFPALLTIRMRQVIFCPQQILSFNTQQKQHSLYLQYTIVLWNCKWVPLSPFTTNPFETLKHPQIIVIVQIPDLLITYTLEKNPGR